MDWKKDLDESSGARLWTLKPLKVEKLHWVPPYHLKHVLANWVWSLLACSSLGTREVTQ